MIVCSAFATRSALLESVLTWLSSTRLSGSLSETAFETGSLVVF